MPTPVLGLISTASGVTSSPLAWPHRVEPGRNRGLLLIVNIRRNKTVSSIDVGGVAATIIGNYVAGIEGNIYFAWLTAPATGDLTVTITFSAAGTVNAVHAYALSLTDVDQTNPYRGFTGLSQESVQSASSIDVAGAAGDFVIDAFTGGRSSSAAGAGQTAFCTAGTVPITILSRRIAAATTTTMSWSWASQNHPTAQVGIAIVGDDTGAVVDPVDPPSRGKGSWWLGANPAGDTHPASDTQYVPISPSNATQGLTNLDAGGQTRMRYAGTLSLPGVRVISNATTTDTVVTLMEDNIATGVTITIPAGQTGVFTGSGTHSVAGAGEELQWRFVTGATGALVQTGIWAWFEPTGSDTVQPVHWLSNGQPNLAPATTYYFSPQGVKQVDANPSDITSPMAMTVELWDITYIVTTRTFVMDIVSRLNGADGAMSLSWPAGDHSLVKHFSGGADTLARGDTWGYRATMGAGANVAEFGSLMAWGRSTSGEFLLCAARTGNGESINSNTTAYVSPQGELNHVLQESDAQFPAPKDMTLLRLFAEVTLNNLTFTAGMGDPRITLRVNGVDTALQLWIGKGDANRHFIDLHHAVAISAGDLISIKVETPAVSTSSMSLRAVGVVGVELAAAPTGPSVSAEPSVVLLSALDPSVQAGALVIGADPSQVQLSALDPTPVRGALDVTADLSQVRLSALDPSVQIGGILVDVPPSVFNLSALDPVAERGALALAAEPSPVQLSALDPLPLAGDLSIAPAPATLRLSALDPTVQTGGLVLTAAPSVVNLSALAPTPVRGSLSLSVPPSQVLLGALDPILDAGGTVIAVDPSVVRLLGLDPTIQRGALVIAPDPAVLRLAAFGAVPLAGDLVVSVAPSVLRLSALDPSVLQGLATPPVYFVLETALAHQVVLDTRLSNYTGLH